MTKSAKSVYYFGYYLLGLGPVIAFAPNTMLPIFGMETTDEVWIRVVGAIVFSLGLYYTRVAPTNNEVFIRTTVLIRFMILGWFIAFVILGWVEAPLILFGVIDAIGAGWTLWEMKKEKEMVS
jgi:hypothetical protein